MTKQEFLDNLRRALTGKVDTYKANETIQYYSDYIDKEIRSGKTEAEVIESLGDPRLLVRTMISAGNATSEFQGNPSPREYTQEEDENTNTYHRVGNNWSNFINKPTLVLAIVLLIVILVLVLIFRVLMFLLPMLLPIVIIVAIIKYFDRR